MTSFAGWLSRSQPNSMGTYMGTNKWKQAESGILQLLNISVLLFINFK